MELNNQLMLKARWVADLMMADNVKPEQVTPELAIAYMDEISKKITAIQSAYLTRIDGRNVMQKTILAISN